MNRYLLDTNHASAVLDGNESVLQRIEMKKEADSLFGISMTVLGELYYQAYASQRQKFNLIRLEDFVERVILWEYDRAAANVFGQIQAEQKRIGKPIPHADAQIAAVARLHKLVVLTADRHFDFVDNLLVENWPR